MVRTMRTRIRDIKGMTPVGHKWEACLYTRTGYASACFVCGLIRTRSNCDSTCIIGTRLNHVTGDK